MNTKSPLMLTITAALTSTGPAAKREFAFRITPTATHNGKLARYDYATYEKIPDAATSFIFRAVLKRLNIIGARDG